jgi:hypothetical protein
MDKLASVQNVETKNRRPPRFVPYAEGQAYLEEKFGLPPVSDRQQREWIKAKRFPAPIQISPGRKAFTDQQLDEYAENLLAQAS